MQHLFRSPLLWVALCATCGFGLMFSSTITPEKVAAAELLFGLRFSPAERDSLLPNLEEQRQGFELVRQQQLPNSLSPSLVFDPAPAGYTMPKGSLEPLDWSALLAEPALSEAQPWEMLSIPELAWLLKARKIRSEALTRYFLDRLKKYNDTLQCVISFTEARALEQARKADRELDAGQWRGMLHGIPYGAKDLLAVEGYKTTWGATPYKDQQLNETAYVVRQLDEAGAVLVAKLSLGALAWGDVWYAGTTKNPWNLQEGSSGSSAGSASAVSAGLLPFAIGTETWGSIVSPASRCGISGLRPSFGAVGRSGAMALSWSMDKIGPMARSATECAIIYDYIRGKDEQDASTRAIPFRLPDARLNALRIAYLKEDFEQDYPNRKNDSIALERLRELGARLEPLSLPNTPYLEGLPAILSAEAAAAFDELTRTNQDSLLVRQVRNAWPNVFRAARFIPAVEYLQANRARRLLIEDMTRLLEPYDVLIAPSFSGNQLLITNLTGHPAVVVPNGLNEKGTPANASFCFIGKLYDEASPLAAARAYQENTNWHRLRPAAFHSSRK